MSKESKIIYSLLALFTLTLLVAFSHHVTTFRSVTADPTEALLRPKKGIAILHINGPIAFSSNPNFALYGSIESLLEQLSNYEKEPKVKALLLRINSPGGTVGASQELYEGIKRYKEKTGNPVVASIADVGASGAYYAAVAADTIFANPGSIVGSIGVIMGNVNFSEFADKHGLFFDVYKSGDYKDMLSSWRNSTEAERALLQGLVENVHAQFVTAVSEGRNLKEPALKTLTNGQFFSGEQGKTLGLVDELGTLKNAIAYTANLVGLPEDPVIIGGPKPSMYELLHLWRDQFGLWIQHQIKSLFSGSLSISA